MGIGFKKGQRETPKKTAKALEADITQLQSQTRNAVMMLQMQMQRLHQRLITVEQQSEMLDFRSLATLKTLVSKGTFTSEEHDAMAELARIEAFEVQSERDNVERKLVPAKPDAVVDTGVVYVARVDAYEPAMLAVPGVPATDDTPAVEPGVIPNPNAGQHIDQLSILRLKVVFGSNEFPKDIEEKIKGTKAGETANFSLECPAELGVYAGKKVDFKIAVLQLFNQPSADAPEVPAAVESTPEPTTPELSIVEKPN